MTPAATRNRPQRRGEYIVMLLDSRAITARADNLAASPGRRFRRRSPGCRHPFSPGLGGIGIAPLSQALRCPALDSRRPSESLFVHIIAATSRYAFPTISCFAPRHSRRSERNSALAVTAATFPFVPSLRPARSRGFVRRDFRASRERIPDRRTKAPLPSGSPSCMPHFARPACRCES